MSGIFIIKGEPTAEHLAALDEQTRQWEMQAARGECGWICADCCATFSAGMPDQCIHGHQSCTDIIKRDKVRAASLMLEAADQKRSLKKGTE